MHRFSMHQPRPCTHQPVVLIERRGAAGAGPATVCDSEERIGFVSHRHWATRVGAAAGCPESQT